MAENVCLASVSKEFLENRIFQEPVRQQKKVKQRINDKQHINDKSTFICVQM